MRTLFWLFVFFCGYVWMVTTHHEEFVLERGKALYKLVSDWFQDAEVEFHGPKKETRAKKERHRRWD